MTFLADREGVSVATDLFCRAMLDALERNDYDRFLKLEWNFYSNIVKAVETAEHYDFCFKAQEPVGRLYGDVLRKSRKLNLPPRFCRRVCYLLPNIDNDLAHVEFLFNILKHHSPGEGVDITVAGYGPSSSPCSSRLLSLLASEGRVRLLKIPDSHVGRVAFLSYFFEKKFSQLIVYSIPLQLNSWVRALGPSLVTWATTKFELGAFSELKNRVSFSGAKDCKIPTGNDPSKNWRRSYAAISRESTIQNLPLRCGGGRLVTINRAEKIRNLDFLKAISQVLAAAPSATFAWTGRFRDSVVQNFFDAAGVADRCEFIGWVDPAQTLAKYDLFLDTFGLSGVVATQAFCSGIPTIFFKNSRSWVEIYEKDLEGVLGVPREMVVAQSVDEYVTAALALIRDPRFYIDRSEAQRVFAARFLFDEKQMHASHMEIIARFVDGIERHGV